MIEIASPTTPQLSSLLPLVVRPRRWCSPNDAPGASREHGRHEKYDPIADREHSIATLYPSKSFLIVIPTARRCQSGTKGVGPDSDPGSRGPGAESPVIWG